jgi:hypothetical protein
MIGAEGVYGFTGGGGTNGQASCAGVGVNGRSSGVGRGEAVGGKRRHRG